MTIIHPRDRNVAHEPAAGHRHPATWRRAALYAALLALAVTLSAPRSAQAEMAEAPNSFVPDSFANEPARLSDAELRGLRGGMMINGVDFDFGATVRVFVDGPLVAETALTLNSDGTIARNTTIHDPATVAEFTDPSQLNGSGLHFGNLNGENGFVISGPNGVSLALNNIKPGDILGLLANDAAGRDIRQTIDVNLTINNFTQISSNLQGSIAMGRAMSAAIPNPILGR